MVYRSPTPLFLPKGLSDALFASVRICDRHEEYISLFADAVPLADQRTPLKMYGDWFQAFRKEILSCKVFGPIGVSLDCSKGLLHKKDGCNPMNCGPTDTD